MSMQRKLISLFMIVLACFIGLSVRLIYITRNNGQEYTKQVFSQQAYENETIPYRRGKITDCKGTVLADSQLVYNVIVDTKAVVSDETKNYLEPTLDALEKLGADAERVREYMEKNPSSQYFIARKNLPYSEKKKFDTQLEEGIREEDEQNLGEKYRYYSNIKGIWFESSYSRTYPSGDLISDVIGFANGANEGSFGLEEYYNEVYAKFLAAAQTQPQGWSRTYGAQLGGISQAISGMKSTVGGAYGRKELDETSTIENYDSIKSELERLEAVFDGLTTGISTVTTAGQTADGQAYDVSGRRVGTTAKGVIIRSGKKMVVK